MKPKLFYIRDDDVFCDDKIFKYIFNFLIENNIPCSYAVIPGKIRNSLINFFNNNIEKRKYFEVIQHGYLHRENLKRVEFGNGISYEKQLFEITDGFKRMKSKLNNFFVPVYVPPFHNYNNTTLKICLKVGFKGFSASRMIKTSLWNKLDFFLCDINFNEYKGYKPLPVDMDFLKRLTIEKIKNYDVLGFYFHHSTLDKYNNIEVFKNYILFLKKLCNKKIIKILKFSDMINKRQETEIK